ncbi:hypothetical protein ES703_89415 [subsurface metagenome]
MNYCVKQEDNGIGICRNKEKRPSPEFIRETTGKIGGARLKQYHDGECEAKFLHPAAQSRHINHVKGADKPEYNSPYRADSGEYPEISNT